MEKLLRIKDYIFKNIKGNPARSIFLILPIAILSFILLAGSVVDSSLNKGMDNMEKRLGADIMIVPKGSADEASNIIVEGARGSFAFDKSFFEDIKDIEGIDEITPQFFLKSLSADCCSSEVEIVFYNPKSDFMIGPWIDKEYSKVVKNDLIIVGSAIEGEDEKSIKLFGEEYEIAGKMAKTGTSLDNSVYFSFDAFAGVIENAKAKGSFLTENQQSDNLISSVFINVKKGFDEDNLIKTIHERIGDDFDIVYPKQMAKDLSVNLNGIYTTIKIFVIVGGILLLIVLFIINIISANDRKRDVALLRIYGVSKKKSFTMLSIEAAFIGIIGSIIGCAFSTLFVIPFGTYIGMSLSMPYLGPDIKRTLILIFIITIITSIIAVLASLIPVLYINNMQPYTALRREGE